MRLRDEAESAATALEDDIEEKQKKLLGDAGPSYVSIARGASSFHRSFKEEDSYRINGEEDKEEIEREKSTLKK